MPRLTLIEAVGQLASFLDTGPLTTAISDMERALNGVDGDRVGSVIKKSGLSQELVDAALIVRRDLGRVSDLIHAAAIVLILPELLESGEHVTKPPSLAAGNDPDRPYDLETTVRICEFKLSHWKGADAMRKRQTFKDLVNLAADSSGRRPELYVVGQAPIRFLRSSRSKASWALDRSPVTRDLFKERFGSLDMPIAEFTAGPGQRVRTIDLTVRFPKIQDSLEIFEFGRSGED